jgi:hypothetical protein
MTIAFSCPGCGKQFKVSENMAGRKAKCSACATIIQVPAAPEQRVAAAPEVRKPARAPAPPDEDIGDDEPAPSRTRKAPPKKKGSKTLLFALIGLGAVTLSMCFCCGGFFGLGYFGVLDPFDLNYRLAGGPPPEYKYLPDKCQMIAVVNVEDILDSDAYKQIKKDSPELDKMMTDDKQLGLKASDVVRITAGGSFDGDGEGVVIIKTKSAIKASDIESKRSPVKYEQVKEGDYTIYAPAKGSFGEAFCVVDDKTLITGKKETLQKVLKRDKKPEFSDSLKSAMSQVRFTKSVAVAMDVKPLQSKVPKGQPGGPDFSEIAGKTDGIGIQIDIGSDIDINAVILCKDDKSAEDARKAIDGILTIGKNVKGLDKDAKDIIEGVKVTSSGSKCTISLKVTADKINKAKKSQKMPFPFPM